MIKGIESNMRILHCKYVPNIGAPIFIKLILTDVKGEKKTVV